MMPASRSLHRSISVHGAVLFSAQALLLAIIFASFRMAWARFFLYVGITFVYHALLTAFLLSRKEDFRVEGMPAPLTRVNLSNSLTFGRLSSIPSILFLIIQASSYPLVPVLLPFACLVFATDFLDGVVARKRNQVTFVGRYLDSTSDYLMIVAVSIVFRYYALIPVWLFILVISRLILFAFGMALLALPGRQGGPGGHFPWEGFHIRHHGALRAGACGAVPRASDRESRGGDRHRVGCCRHHRGVRGGQRNLSWKAICPNPSAAPRVRQDQGRIMSGG